MFVCVRTIAGSKVHRCHKDLVSMRVEEEEFKLLHEADARVSESPGLKCTI